MLKRAIRTCWIALDELDLLWIPVIRSWRLNERHYGALQGLNKAETAAKHGEEQVEDLAAQLRHAAAAALSRTTRGIRLGTRATRRCRRPTCPLTESLKDTVARFLPYWEDAIAPAIRAATRADRRARQLAAGAGQVSRPDFRQDIVELNIPTGIPLVYELDEPAPWCRIGIRSGGSGGRRRAPGRRSPTLSRPVRLPPPSLRRRRCAAIGGTGDRWRSSRPACAARARGSARRSSPATAAPFLLLAPRDETDHGFERDFHFVALPRAHARGTLRLRGFRPLRRQWRRPAHARTGSRRHPSDSLLLAAGPGVRRPLADSSRQSGAAGVVGAKSAFGRTYNGDAAILRTRAGVSRKNAKVIWGAGTQRAHILWSLHALPHDVVPRPEVCQLGDGGPTDGGPGDGGPRRRRLRRYNRTTVSEVLR